DERGAGAARAAADGRPRPVLPGIGGGVGAHAGAGRRRGAPDRGGGARGGGRAAAGQSGEAGRARRGPARARDARRGRRLRGRRRGAPRTGAGALAPVALALALAAPCSPAPSPAYVHAVRDTLAARRDVWGDALLRAPNGPSYDAARRYLAPLLYARGRGGSRLTASGVYYLPFAYPLSVYGDRGYALHVADGSEIVTRRVGGRRLSIQVGREVYGSWVARLPPARLADGWLPILETAY